jgi:hypothetical protein
VCEAKAQTLRSEYDQLRHKPGESIDDLALRLTGITSRLSELGDPESDKKIMQKWLRIVPKRYSQLAHSIDNLVRLEDTTIEELVGRFKAAEERDELDAEEEGGTKLLLTEEEWHARDGRGSYSGGSSGGKKPRAKGQTYRGKDAAHNGKGAPRRDGNCRYCGKAGHCARECRNKECDEGGAAAHVTEAEADADPALLMALVMPVDLDVAEKDDMVVHLNEERARPAWELRTT